MPSVSSKCEQSMTRSSSKSFQSRFSLHFSALIVMVESIQNVHILNWYIMIGIMMEFFPQYDAFVKFIDHQIQKRFNESMAPSYLS